MLDKETIEKARIQYDEFRYVFATIAWSVMRAKISPEVYSAWLALSRAGRVADALLDTNPDNQARVSLERDIIRYLRGAEIDTQIPDAQELREAFGQLPQLRQRKFIRRLNCLFSMTELSRYTIDIQEYAKMKDYQGRLYASLYLDFLPSEIETNSQFPRYERLSKRAPGVVTRLDACVDLRADFGRGETKIQPSLSNRLTLLANAMRDSGIIFKEVIPSPYYWYQLGRWTYKLIRSGLVERRWFGG